MAGESVAGGLISGNVFWEDRVMDAQYAQLLQLSTDEKLELVAALWDSIAASAESLPVPDWQKEELDRREAARRQNPDLAMSWEEAKERIRKPNG